MRWLLSQNDDSTLLDSIHSIEETSDDQHRLSLWKDWTIIQCCVSDGTCNPKGGSYPLNHCILGGQHLLPPNDGYMAVLVKPSEVVDVDVALSVRDRSWFRRRIHISFSGDEAISDNALDQLCDQFDSIKAFYRVSAEAGTAVLFTTDETLDAIYKA
jgi:hypothetical protein